MTTNQTCTNCGKDFERQVRENQQETDDLHTATCYQCVLDRLCRGRAPEEGDYNAARVCSGEMSDNDVQWLREDLLHVESGSSSRVFFAHEDEEEDLREERWFSEEERRSHYDEEDDWSCSDRDHDEECEEEARWYREATEDDIRDRWGPADEVEDGGLYQPPMPEDSRCYECDRDPCVCEQLAEHEKAERDRWEEECRREDEARSAEIEAAYFAELKEHEDAWDAVDAWATALGYVCYNCNYRKSDCLRDYPKHGCREMAEWDEQNPRTPWRRFTDYLRGIEWRIRNQFNS